jgi:hypothetical protein
MMRIGIPLIWGIENILSHLRMLRADTSWTSMLRGCRVDRSSARSVVDTAQTIFGFRNASIIWLDTRWESANFSCKDSQALSLRPDVPASRFTACSSNRSSSRSRAIGFNRQAMRELNQRETRVADDASERRVRCFLFPDLSKGEAKPQPPSSEISKGVALTWALVCPGQERPALHSLGTSVPQQLERRTRRNCDRDKCDQENRD